MTNDPSSSCAESGTNLDLAQALHKRGRTPADMSHDLRTPLTAILAVAEMLKDEIYGPLNERQHKHVSTIEVSVRQLLKLIHETFDVTQEAPLEDDGLPSPPSSGVAQEAPVMSSAEPSSPLILLADDNATNLEIMSDYLEMKGYRIIQAKNGGDAVRLAATASPALAVMDIQMPDMDGLEAIKLIRASSHQGAARMPIIVLTGMTTPQDRERCMAAGGDDYLSKPVSLKDLGARIRELLHAR